MDIRDYNRAAWNRAVASGNRWTIPVDAATVERARAGDFEIVLTPTRPVPRAWFPPLAGCDVLGLASGGGQQMPILAAAGARVTSFDLSPAQLGQDASVATREGLAIRTVEGDMRDLSAFPDASFDLIFHPCSNVFVEEIRPVWRECARVLRRGGTLLAGFSNPVLFALDDAAAERGELVMRHAIPYSDVTSLTDEERARYTSKGEPLAFGHTLEDQIGGQLDAGLWLTGFFEDRNPGDPLARLMDTYIATRATKA